MGLKWTAATRVTPVRSKPMSNVRHKWFDLPLGARFRYIGGRATDVYVKISNEDCGVVARWITPVPDGRYPGQGVFSFADSRREMETLVVDAVVDETNEVVVPSRQLHCKHGRVVTNGCALCIADYRRRGVGL